MTPHPTDGLFTLRCSERPTEISGNLPEGGGSASSSSTAAAIIDLHPSDAVGNLLSRPEIDEPDAPPLYSVQLINDSGSLDLLDPLSASVLTSTTSLAANKLRQITLHNPTQTVEVKNKSLISYSWVFDWEGSRYVWNRSRDTISTRDSGYTCKLERKPDPDVDVVRYKPVKKGNLIQILDYNLDRFAHEDRKGLELALLSSLFGILQGDKLDEHTKPSTDQAVAASLAGGTNEAVGPSSLKRQDSDEVETVSPNEILISPHLADNAYVAHCLNLLSDPNLVFLSLTATSAETVPRAIVIASEIKRLLLKQANDDISQYVDYPGRRPSTSAGAAAGVKENGASSGRGAMAGNAFADKAPPRQIKIYLSRIPLEEFVPKPQRHNSAGEHGGLSDKERMAQHFAAQEGQRQVQASGPGPVPGAGSAPTPLPGSTSHASGNGRPQAGTAGGIRTGGAGPSERRHNSGPTAPSPSLPTGRASDGHPSSAAPPSLPDRSKLQKVSDGRGGYNPPLPPKSTGHFPRTQSQHEDSAGKKKSFWTRVSERVCD